MEDETIRPLVEQKRRKWRKMLLIFILVVGIVGILNVFFLFVLGILLMIIGVITSINTGNALLEWRYYHTNMRSGFDDVFKMERKDRAMNFGIGAISSVVGLLIFILSLYLYSVGWFGLITT